LDKQLSYFHIGDLDSGQQAIIVKWYNSLGAKNFAFNVGASLCDQPSPGIQRVKCDNSSPQKVIKLYMIF